MAASKPSSRDRVRAHRERMRAKGLRPATVWVFDDEHYAQLLRDCEAIARAERTNPLAKADADWAFAVSEEMMRHLDETEPYDWGPNGAPV